MTRPDPAPPIILASASPTRLDLLRRAGITVEAIGSGLDEAPLKQRLRASDTPADGAALALAAAKAIAVAARHSGRLVIGADQILELDGAWLDKPGNPSAAARQIAQLAGRRHRLVSAVTAVRDGRELWHAVDQARLTMRPLDARTIDAYLAEAGPGILGSVGGYQIEGPGIRLFEAIDGDYFTILGLPLLPLLAFLRGAGLGA
jgi:septum formation protein